MGEFMSEPAATYATKQPTEHDEQAALITWARLQSFLYPGLDLLHAIPNGFQLPGNVPTWKRAQIVNHMKDEGLLPGIPDLFLPVARKGWHGLYLEMKSRTGTVRPEQVALLDRLHEQGYLATVCRSFEEAKEAIEEYYAP
jgi:hypothetical protein